ncbi:MAG TPA: DUF4157 domain-containing protein, partial [Bacteroidetes bacterium]|nr:DUF4157 domain-containing protein [Bacteroidota bacterium]
MSETEKVNQRKEQKTESSSPSFGTHPMESSNAESEAGGNSISPVPFQLKASSNAAAPGDGGNDGGNPGGLPGQLKASLESMSGMDMGDVSVKYNSAKPAQMKAHAYAQGSEIHLGPGQEKHLPHEAWHVVQQKEGRVKANTNVNGAAVNNDAGLESEADQMGAKAMAGVTQQKAAPNKTSSPAASGPVQRKAFNDDTEKEEYFKEYKETAETVLKKWYEKTKTKDGRDKLTASLFENAARKIYTEKKDTKYIVPVEFAMAQARLEGGVARRERLGQGNIFNVAAYDSGVSGSEKKINTLEKGFNAYYKFMANSMLDDKSADQLLEGGNFTKGANKTGGVYATNPVYEAEIKGEIGKMRMASDSFKLSGTVGLGAGNKDADVKKVGGLLVTAGYLAKADVADKAKVGAAILSFQKKELAPTDKKWFKDRKKAVTNPTDLKNVNIKIGWFKDGVVSNSGHTLGALYYKSVMGGHIAKEAASSNTSGTKVKKPAKSSEAKKEDTGYLEGIWDYVSDTAEDIYDSVAETASELYDSAADYFGFGSDDKKVDTKAKKVPKKPAAAPASIATAVGAGVKKNNKKDVMVVQGLLVKGGYLPALNAEGKTNVDGVCGQVTIKAIKSVQIKAGFKKPDGRVDVGGATWKILAGQSAKGKNAGKIPVKPAAPAAKILASVGNGGKNNEKDVKAVQGLLVSGGFLAAVNAKGETNVDGVCGRGTIAAIRKLQKNKGGFSKPDGRVDVGGTTWKLLTGQPVTKRKGGNTKTKADVAARPTLSASGDIIEQIKTNFPDGVNVAIYTKYAKTGKKSKDNNNAEFPRAAGKYAKAFNSIGYDGSGTIKLGLAQPITDLAGVTNVINDVHKLLLKEHKKTNQDSKDIPAFTKIKTLALFSHGMQWGLHLKQNGRYNARIDSDKEEKKFETFVKGIKGSLKDDVVVNLFACNAGREADGTEKKGVWGLDAAEKQDGSSSFGAKFAEELGGDASVYAHLSAGHTVNNYSARVFGKDAGKDASKDQAGVHIFRLLYDDAFVTAEATRLGKTKKAVSAKMWKHFKVRMSDSHKGKFSIENNDGKTEKVGLGA